MNEPEFKQSKADCVCWIDSACFAAYAEADLDRWRQVIGEQVEHRDPRWGFGQVEAVTWGSCCKDVPAYVQIRIRYEGDLIVTAHSETWHEHHVRVSIPDIVDQAIRTCLDPSLSSEERRDCLLRHSRQLRERRDQLALDRAAQRKRS